ncbi:hypothetical protein ZWY2020_030063 [Hordeum vulgare]|nr:hypothetical protein ZWY2020_030063 [Hordeum vulgare]
MDRKAPLPGVYDDESGEDTGVDNILRCACCQGGYSDGSSSSSTGFNRKGKGMLPPKVIPSPPSSVAGSSSTPSLDYATTLKAGAFGGRESSSVVGGSKGQVTWSDPVAAEMREVPNAAGYPFYPKMVSRQRMVKERGGVDKEKSLWTQQHIPRHLQVQLLKQDTLGHHQNLKNEISSPISVLERKSEELHKVQFHGASPMLHVTTMEKARKWEPDSLKRMESHDAYLITSQLNLLDEQQDASYVATLQLELRQARDRVGELESERRSTKKNP